MGWRPFSGGGGVGLTRSHTGKPPPSFLMKPCVSLPSSSLRLYDLRINKESGDTGNPIQNQQEKDSSSESLSNGYALSIRPCCTALGAGTGQGNEQSPHSHGDGCLL